MQKVLLKRENRIGLYLAGVGMQLRAIFQRTSAHKLPAKMGELREDAVCKFFNEWLPTKYSAQTNVIPVHQGIHDFDRELDLVVLNSNSGFRLPLDADGGVALVGWSDIKLHLEVKSVLNSDEYAKANDVAHAIKKFGIRNDAKSPRSILFAYDCDQDTFDALYGQMMTASYGIHLDAIAILGKGIYFSPEFSDLASQIESGLSTSMAARDGNLATKQISREIRDVARPGRFEAVGGVEDADVLFGLMAFAAHSLDDTGSADELVMAAKRQDYSPIYEEETFNDHLIAIAEDDWAKRSHEKEFREYIARLRQRDADSWNTVLLRRYGIYVYEITKITYGEKPPAELKGKYLPFYDDTFSITDIDREGVTPSSTFDEAVKKTVKYFHLDQRAMNDLNLEQDERLEQT